MQVLIVDDDYMVCCCVQRQINWKGIGCEEPEIVCNGQAALEYIEKNRPDIVISDIRMPIMDGLELCTMVTEKYPDISMIFLSAYEDFAAARLALRCNVKGYLLKPLDRDGLNELESMVYDIVCQKSNKALFYKIAADEYHDFLLDIIVKQDVDTLEELFDKIKEFYEDPAVRNINIWTHMITPVYAYQYSRWNADSRLIYEEEKRAKEGIRTLSREDKITYLRDLYLRVMAEDNRNESEGDIMDEIHKTIQEKFTSTDFNISMLAEMLKLTPAYIGRLFFERTGTRLVDYLSDLRLEHACKMLRETAVPVKEICVASGYMDANYFARLFRRKVGMSPVEYRSKHKS